MSSSALLGARWLLGGLLSALGAYVLAVNWLLIARWLWTRKKGPSTIPVIGGICGALGLFILPVAGATAWSLLPLAFEPLVFFAALRLLGIRFQRKDAD